MTIKIIACWCYGFETMDMSQYLPKTICGFIEIERIGAVYLATTLIAHNQKCIPAFGICGRDVHNINYTDTLDDVKEKLLKFTKAGLIVATMLDKSYLTLGGVSMGITALIVDSSFFEIYLGMGYESLDISELIKRIDEEIYDKEKHKLALDWVKNLNEIIFIGTIYTDIEKMVKIVLEKFGKIEVLVSNIGIYKQINA